MKNIYIASLDKFAGKGMLCLALSFIAKAERKKIGYFKPIGSSFIRIGEETIDEDVRFFKSLLNLEEDEDLLCPLLLTPDVILNFLMGKKDINDNLILNAYKKIQQDKDIIFIDGIGRLSEGYGLNLPFQDLVNSLEAQVVLVAAYTSELIVDGICMAKNILKDKLAGVVINKVPEGKFEMLKDLFTNFLKKRGINALAIIPEDKILSSVSVAGIIEKLEGEVLCCPEKTEELVENLAVGAMNVESALRYFRRIQDKAVITGGDRGDIQLAALETSTKCLILTGSNYPPAPVLSKAEEVGVPVIAVKGDSLQAIERIEEVMGRLHIEGIKKVERVKTIVDNYFNKEKILELWK